MLQFVLFVLTLPAPSGPHLVGTRTAHFVDHSRRDPVDSRQDRGILVQFWYPARSVSGCARARYLSSDLLDAMKLDQYLNVDLGMLDGWDKLTTHSFVNAQPMSGGCPLLLFSPGFGMSRSSYTTLAEELASYGLCVALIDHPYGGLSIYPDGLLRNYVLDKTKPPIRVKQMAADDSFLLTQLHRSLKGIPLIDWRHVFVAGHSIGGAAALEVGRTDKRVSGAIDLDGDVWGDVESFGTRKPFLVLLNQPGPPVKISQRMKDQRRKEWESVVRKSPVSATVLELGPAYHFTFSDAPFLLPASELKDNGATLKPVKSRNLICTAVLSFVRPGRRFRQNHLDSRDTSIILQKSWDSPLKRP